MLTSFRACRGRAAALVLVIAGVFFMAANSRLGAQLSTARFTSWPIPIPSVGSGIFVDRNGSVGSESPAGAVWASTRGVNVHVIRLIPGNPVDTAPGVWTAWPLDLLPGQNGTGIEVTSDDQVFVRTNHFLQRLDPATNLRTRWLDSVPEPSTSDLAIGLADDIWTIVNQQTIQRLTPDAPDSANAEVTRWVAPNAASQVAFAGIDVEPQTGLVYFAAFHLNQIVQLNPATNELRSWSITPVGAFTPNGISVDIGGDVWASTMSNHLVRLRPSTNQLTSYLIPTPAATPFTLTAEGVVGFTEHSPSRVGMLIPDGGDVVVPPTLTTIPPTTTTLVGEITFVPPIAGQATPVNSDLPATVSGTDETGTFIEAGPNSRTAAPLGIDRDPFAAPGTFYFAALGDIIGRVTLASPISALVTGGGSFEVPGGTANFGFNVSRQYDSGPVRGHLQFHNHATGENIHSEVISDLFVSGNGAVFGGTMHNNGLPGSFRVEVVDQGEPGKSDTFRITPIPGTPVGNTLSGGNIQVHQR